MKSTTSPPLRVGFDLDGVLLYNPARIARPIIEFTKTRFLNKKKTSFYVPKSPVQTFLWDMLHKSSMYPAKGFDQVEKLVSEGHMEAYIITARFKHLVTNTNKWFLKLNKNNTFTDMIYNQHDQQAHIFKYEHVSRLKLDVFIDDNWNIVEHLNQNTSTQILWVTNIFDKNISYTHKHPNLLSAVDYLSDQIIKTKNQ